MSNVREALIIPFDGEFADHDGEPLQGWYWQIVDGHGEQVGGLMGPYATGPEAEAACRRAFERGDY